MILACDSNHDTVKWSWVDGYDCWYCGKRGEPAHTVDRRHRVGYAFHAPTTPPNDAA